MNKNVEKVKKAVSDVMRQGVRATTQQSPFSVVVKLS